MVKVIHNTNKGKSKMKYEDMGLHNGPEEKL